MFAWLTSTNYTHCAQCYDHRQVTWRTLHIGDLDILEKPTQYYKKCDQWPVTVQKMHVQIYGQSWLHGKRLFLCEQTNLLKKKRKKTFVPTLTQILKLWVNEFWMNLKLSINFLPAVYFKMRICFSDDIHDRRTLNKTYKFMSNTVICGTVGWQSRKLHT